MLNSAFGRTGTRSLKDALEMLGLGPCHHMEEVFDDPGQVAQWQAFAAGQPVDWREVFAGYSSQVDWPGAHVWRELAETFPDAKIVHTIRPDDAWWNSFSDTIGKAFTHPNETPVSPSRAKMREVMIDMVGHGTFDGRWTERDVAVAAYRHRLEEVTEAIPSDRLLVFDVSHGWDPLCEFLDLPVPDEPFPNRNTKDQFWDQLGGERG